MGQQLLLLWKWSVTLVTAAYPGGSVSMAEEEEGKFKKRKKVQTMSLRFVMKDPQETDCRDWMKYRRGWSVYKATLIVFSLCISSIYVYATSLSAVTGDYLCLPPGRTF